jgi:membrane AbrB-like protein
MEGANVPARDAPKREMSLRRLLPWSALLVASVLVAELVRRAGFPASYLLGPMLCAVAFGVAGIELRLSRPFQSFSQGIIGCLVARSLTPGILGSIAHDWPIMLLVISTTVLAGGLVGWVLVKLGTLPGTTAAWGSSPGAASAMVLMSGEFGADVRLVGFMQYLRVVIVVFTASMVSRLLLGGPVPAVPAGAVESSIPVVPLIETLALAIGGAALGRLLKVPSGALLVPMILGAVFHATGLVVITLPSWLLHVAYVVIGWYVGLTFDRVVLNSVFKATPTLVLSTLLLIGLCMGSAWLLTRLLGVDLLTAYLATSPGGLDSIAVIATSIHTNVSFILAIQTMRLFLVLLTGPAIARLISRYA